MAIGSIMPLLQCNVYEEARGTEETHGLYDLVTRGGGDGLAGGVFTAWRAELARRLCKGGKPTAALARRRVGAFIEGPLFDWAGVWLAQENFFLRGAQRLVRMIKSHRGYLSCAFEGIDPLLCSLQKCKATYYLRCLATLMH